MINDPNRLFDGFDSMEGGVDAGRRSNVIGINQCESADNVTFRGGIPTTRPGIRVMVPNFINPNFCYNTDGTSTPPGTIIIGQESTTNFYNGVFQSACYYSPKNAPEVIMALIGGRLYKLTPRGYNPGLNASYTVDIEEIPLPQRNRSTIPIAYLIQADKWLIGQDNESLPIIYDGISARRAASDEVPVGSYMAYGMGRIVVIRNQQEIWFGDLYGSHAGTDPGDSVIKFTETTFLSEGFPASIPFSLGRITGLAFIPQLDTSTGIGQLIVFTDRGGSSFDLSIPRDQWKTSAFALLTLLTTGLRGWRSPSAVNEDLWFRASDGARSYRQARSEETGWHHLPFSTNIEQWFNNDAPELLDYCHSIYFDNQLIFTTSPVWNHGRLYHNGLVVLDFDILSSFGTNSRPAWNGHWSNLQTTALVTGIFRGKRRAFAFAVSGINTENGFYEIATDDRDDYNGPISSEMVTRTFDFSRDKGSNPFSEKELYGGDVWVNEVSDNGAFMDVAYKPDGYPDWLAWGPRLNFNAIGTFQAVDPSTGSPTAQPGFAPRSKLQKPPTLTDPTTKRQLRRGFGFQAKFNWTGYLEFERFRIQGQQLVENSRAS